MSYNTQIMPISAERRAQLYANHPTLAQDAVRRAENPLIFSVERIGKNLVDTVNFRKKFRTISALAHELQILNQHLTTSQQRPFDREHLPTHLAERLVAEGAYNTLANLRFQHRLNEIFDAEQAVILKEGIDAIQKEEDRFAKLRRGPFRKHAAQQLEAKIKSHKHLLIHGLEKNTNPQTGVKYKLKDVFKEDGSPLEILLKKAEGHADLGGVLEQDSINAVEIYKRRRETKTKKVIRSGRVRRAVTVGAIGVVGGAAGIVYRQEIPQVADNIAQQIPEHIIHTIGKVLPEVPKIVIKQIIAGASLAFGVATLGVTIVDAVLRTIVYQKGIAIMKKENEIFNNIDPQAAIKNAIRDLRSAERFITTPELPRNKRIA